MTAVINILCIKLIQIILTLLLLSAITSCQLIFKSKVTSDISWIRRAVDKHNYYRSLHNVPELTFNHTIAEISQGWADKCLRTGLQHHLHSWPNMHNIYRGYMGESIYSTVSNRSSKLLSGNIPVEVWYNETKDYDFKRGPINGSSAVTRHFTQIVWALTTDIGIAYATGKGTDDLSYTFVVANYYPPGNIVGESNKRFLENVYPSAGLQLQISLLMFSLPLILSFT